MWQDNLVYGSQLKYRQLHLWYNNLFGSANQNREQGSEMIISLYNIYLLISLTIIQQVLQSSSDEWRRL